MKMLAALAFAAFLIAAPLGAFAQPAAGLGPTVTLPALIPAPAGMIPQVGVTPTPIIINQGPAADTSISFGTLGAQLLGWVSAVFVPVLGAFLTKWVMAMAKKAGIEASQAMSDKLDGIIENGLHSGATAAQKDLTGKLNVDVKNQVIAQAVTYAQDHGAETIKSLSGCDPNDPKAIEALQARAAKVLSNIGPDAVLAPTAAAIPSVATAA